MSDTTEEINGLERLKKRSDFLRVQSKGNKWVAKGFILQTAPNNTKNARFGITATKKLAKSAVTRNRIKRRLRSLAQDILPACAKPGMDYVFIGRHETETRPYSQLQGDLKWCLKKLGLELPSSL